MPLSYIYSNSFFANASMDEFDEQTSKQILDSAFVGGKRPSIETFLHSISGKYTLHTHPIAVNALTCRKEGMKTLAELFRMHC